MSSERKIGASQPPAEQLRAIFNASREIDPAAPEMFQDTAEEFRAVAGEYPLPEEEGGIRDVYMSELLRRTNREDDGIRFRLEADPRGLLRGGASYEGHPSIAVSIEQENEDATYPEGNKIGSWAMVVTLLAEEDTIIANATGVIKTGPLDRDIAQLPGCEPQITYPATQDLFSWIWNNLGAPSDLRPVAAETD